MTFVGGREQAEFMTRLRGVDPGQCLVVPIDVGKRAGVAMIADRYHEVVVGPFEFPLTEPGFEVLAGHVARAEAARDAVWCRIGIEAAGHYHYPLVARLRDAGFDVVELNPGAVKEARAKLGQRRLKSDVRDCYATVELLVDGVGRPRPPRDEALAVQAAWAAHRRRKVAACAVLQNQVHAASDLAFPGLVGCYTDPFHRASLLVLLRELCDPERVQRLGVERLRSFVGRRGVRLFTPKAIQIVAAAREALRLPAVERQAASPIVAADMALFDHLRGEIVAAEQVLADILPATPRSGAHLHPRRLRGRRLRLRRRPR
jgi:transposase